MSTPVDSPPPTPAPPVRVAIVQQIVPRYRVPAFDLLARQPGVDLTVYSGMRAMGSLKHVPSPGSYCEKPAPVRTIAGVMWQPGQIEAARCGMHDVIIFSWNARLAHLPRALRLCWRRGTPTLLWGHGFSKSESAWRRRLRNRLINLADGCIVYSRAAVERLAQDGFDRRRLFLAQNALDQQPIAKARATWLANPDALSAFQREHSVSPRSAALFISRLEADKRIDMLLRAWEIVVGARPEAKLVLIGKGREEDRLRDLARQLHIEGNVTFAGSVYEEDRLAPWFLSAACMAYPAAIGLSIFHAFGYGLPVVTSNDIASHNPEVEALTAGNNGMVYHHGDIDDFAAKLLTCMNDDAARIRMSEAALTTVRSPDGYCLERMAQGFMDAIAFVRTHRQ